MALTKISTGGVKDNAIETSKIADGHVRQMDLDGECVNESKIQVSNAGTNGQFLQKSSGTGGLTWATVDTNLSSDTTPQLGGDVDTNDHNIEFKDRNGTDDANVLNFGAGDDMRFYSDGDYGYIQADTELRIGTASNTTNAVFTNTKFDFRKDVDITNSAKLGIGGSYGSSGQVLTSGGSGAAPSWADATFSSGSASNLNSGTLPDARFPSTLPAVSGANLTNLPAGGNTIDLVADGAIAAGKPVIITSAGKAQVVQEQGTASGPSSYHTWEPIASYTPRTVAVAQDRRYTDYRVDAICAGGNDVRFKAYNAQTGSNSGGVTMVGSGNGVQSGSMIGDLIYLEHVDLFLCSVTAGSDQNTGTGNSLWFCIEHSNNNSLSLKYQPVSNNLSSTKVHDLEYSGQNNTIDTCFSVVDQSGGLKILGPSAIYSNGNIQAGTDTISVDTNAAIISKMKFNSDRSKFIIVYMRWSNRRLYARGGSWDGTNGASTGITLGSEVEVGPNAALHGAPFEWGTGVSLACDVKTNTWVVAYQYNNQAKAKVLTLSGTTVSAGAELTISTTNPDGKFAVVDNFDVPNCVTWAGLYQHGMGIGNLVISGTSLSNPSGLGQFYGAGPDADCNVGMDSETIKLSGQSSPNGILANWRRNGSASRAGRAHVSTAGTNLTDKNVIGFANSAISDTATGTINVQGSVATGQSGLTAGQIYFIQDDGSLGASIDSTQANLLAIASDKGLIQTRTAWV